MRTLEKNKREFWYANYVEKKPVYSGELKTGEWETVYTIPFRSDGNISAARGEAETRQFGESLDYDRAIALDAPNTLINEYSILWVDTLPEFNEHGINTVPPDYIVKRVARSLNSALIAISRVDVGNEDNDDA